MDWSAVQSCRPTPVLASHGLTELSSPMQLRALTHECNKLGLPWHYVACGTLLRQFHGLCMKPVGLWSTLARAQNPGESLYVITGRVSPGNPQDGRGSRGIMAPARAPYPPSIKLGVCCSGCVYFQIACCWWFFNTFLCIRVLYVPGLNFSFNEAWRPHAASACMFQRRWTNLQLSQYRSNEDSKLRISPCVIL